MGHAGTGRSGCSTIPLGWKQEESPANEKTSPRIKPLSTTYRTGKSLYTREERGYSLDLQAGEHCLVDPGEKAEECVTGGTGGSGVPFCPTWYQGCWQTRCQHHLWRCHQSG